MKQLLLMCLFFASVGVFAQVTILDFETPATSTSFQAFGGTVEGVVYDPIPNPDATGINTSANVIGFNKAVGSVSWSGGFANPAPVTPIDLSTGPQVCIKVHMDEPRTVTVKLEDSATNANWEQTVLNETLNQWVEMCFDSNLPSTNGDGTIAAGHIYEQVVVFFNLAVDVGDTDEITYFDDIIVKNSDGPTTSEVTFTVNMNDYTEPFTGVFVGGGFNDWDFPANPLTDNGDGTYSTTITLNNGGHEFLFATSNGLSFFAETLSPTDVCTFTTDDGEFTNRYAVVTGDVEIGPTCYNSCYNCGEGRNISISLNMNNETVSEDGVFLAGGDSFGHGDYLMTDDDEDGIYTITIERELGFESDYTFINGICLPNWECKEDIEGQDCAVGEFNDRHMGPILGDLSINTCFGFCSTDGSCGQVVEQVNVTFQVNMENATISDAIYVGGAFDGWSGTTPLQDQGNGVWSTTLMADPGQLEYKFVNSGVWEELNATDHAECTVTTPDGAFTNRTFEVPESDIVIDVFCFESCEICEPDISVENVLSQSIKITPTMVTNMVDVNLLKTFNKVSISIYNLSGKLLATYPFVKQNTHKIDMSNFDSGMYFINIQADGETMSQKVVKR